MICLYLLIVAGVAHLMISLSKWVDAGEPIAGNGTWR